MSLRMHDVSNRLGISDWISILFSIGIVFLGPYYNTYLEGFNSEPSRTFRTRNLGWWHYPMGGFQLDFQFFFYCDSLFRQNEYTEPAGFNS